MTTWKVDVLKTEESVSTIEVEAETYVEAGEAAFKKVYSGHANFQYDLATEYTIREVTYVGENK